MAPTAWPEAMADRVPRERSDRPERKVPTECKVLTERSAHPETAERLVEMVPLVYQARLTETPDRQVWLAE